MEPERMSQEEFMKAALKYQAALVAYAYARLRDYHLADDVVQDALIVMMKKWSDFEPGGSIYAFARKIVYFKTLEALRARQKQEIALEDEQLEAAVDRTMEESLDEESAERQSDRVYVLQECLSQLTRKALDLVAGFYQESKSYQELSVIHAQSLPAIKKALYRYRKILQDCAARKLRHTETA
jgi:RNA polymerase sigma factor (sigma-70 family)